MGKYTAISSTAFNELQLDTGVLLSKFDPANPAESFDEDIICSTTGGITISCVPTYTDMGEDIDNCPNNMLELKRTSQYECKMAFAALSVTEKTIAMALGAVDIADGMIVPREIKLTDFKDVWWAGDLSNGDAAVVCLKNALSASGFSLKTAKNEKGQLSMELLGHYSIENQKDVPMEFYIIDAPTA